jgi:lipoprotein-anchoring transpeptidase ErfK/SrfK
MRRSIFLAALLGLALALPGAAFASVVAQINLSSQRMHVFVNGKPAYTWKVSTARSGYRTPTGTYKPYHLARRHYSSIYNNSTISLGARSIT